MSVLLLHKSVDFQVVWYQPKISLPALGCFFFIVVVCLKKKACWFCFSLILLLPFSQAEALTFNWFSYQVGFYILFFILIHNFRQQNSVWWGFSKFQIQTVLQNTVQIFWAEPWGSVHVALFFLCIFLSLPTVHTDLNTCLQTDTLSRAQTYLPSLYIQNPRFLTTAPGRI